LIAALGRRGFSPPRQAEKSQSFKAAMPLDPSNVTWLVPWHPIAHGRADSPTAKELYRELCKTHVLYGIQVRPVAQRQDCDDVLFELLDESGRFATVHLTYAQHPETNPLWPETVIYRDLSEFIRSMEEDAADWM
jgi:hypothetical protein